MTMETAEPVQPGRRRGRPRKNPLPSGAAPRKKSHLMCMSEAFMASYSLGMREANQ